MGRKVGGVELQRGRGRQSEERRVESIHWSVDSLFDVMYLLIAWSDDPVRYDVLFALILMTQWHFQLKLIVVDTVKMTLFGHDFDGSVHGSGRKLDTILLQSIFDIFSEIMKHGRRR